jgi:diguanylate cyclase (GGDEF)-like protein/putative nucleotidyltransferase with HDIG domain
MDISSDAFAHANGFRSDSGASRDGALRQANRLLRVAQSLASAVDAETVSAILAGTLGELTGDGLVAVYTIPEPGTVRLASVRGADAEADLGRAPQVVLRALRERRIVAAGAAELADLWDRGCHTPETFAAPLLGAGEALGAVIVGARPGGAVGVHPGLVLTAADLAGSALANARRFAATFDEARTDPLTGIGNHRAFYERLDADLRAAASTGDDVTLVLFDLDDFKRVNDVAGHPAGDRVLRDVARIATGFRRGEEELFRLGGDEFAIVVAGDAEAGASVAERIRSAVAAECFALSVTISAGVAAFPADARTKDELLHKADFALYAAKRSGKSATMRYRRDVHGPTGRSTAEALYGALQEQMESKASRQTALGDLAQVAAAARGMGREQSEDAVLEAGARYLTATLGATGCVISRLVGDGGLRNVATYSPPPWDLADEFMYLVADFPLTAEALETGEPRAVALSDDPVDESEAHVLHGLGMHAVLMLPLRVEGESWGLVEVYDARTRSFDESDTHLADLVVGHLEALLARFKHASAVEQLYRQTLASLMSALEVKDDYTSEHAHEVGGLAGEVARRLGLDGDELRTVELGALMHDIGKIRIPESILNKPGPLDDEEWEVMRTHPELGARILAPIASLAPVVPIVRSSHERWDGRGYPEGLAGEAIPIGARIASACDAFRAMIEPRPYREPLKREQALAELTANAGTQFDPACVEALVVVLEQRELGPKPLQIDRPSHLLA